MAAVDAKHQIIVEAQAHGTGSEQELLIPLVDALATQRRASTQITADAGYHSEANLKAVDERGIDALIADTAMRQRDERFADRAHHTDTPDPLHEKRAPAPKRALHNLRHNKRLGRFTLRGRRKVDPQ